MSEHYSNRLKIKPTARSRLSTYLLSMQTTIHQIEASVGNLSMTGIVRGAQRENPERAQRILRAPTES